MKTAFWIFVLAGFVSAFDLDYTKLVCLSDSSGRTVTIGGKDTSAITMTDVIQVVFKNQKYTILFKSGKEIILTNPPFSYVSVVIKDK